MILAVSRIKVRLFYSPVAKLILCVGDTYGKKNTINGTEGQLRASYK